MFVIKAVEATIMIKATVVTTALVFVLVVSVIRVAVTVE